MLESLEDAEKRNIQNMLEEEYWILWCKFCANGYIVGIPSMHYAPSTKHYFL